jgi:metal transporter CNNM
VKREVKQGLTQRLRQRVGMGDTDSDTDSDDEKKGETVARKKWGGRRRLIGGSSSKGARDIEEGNEDSDTIKESRSSDSQRVEDKEAEVKDDNGAGKKSTERRRSMVAGLSVLEQSMPADAVLAKAGAAEVKSAFGTFCPLSDNVL